MSAWRCACGCSGPPVTVTERRDLVEAIRKFHHRSTEAIELSLVDGDDVTDFERELLHCLGVLLVEVNRRAAEVSQLCRAVRAAEGDR